MSHSNVLTQITIPPRTTQTYNQVIRPILRYGTPIPDTAATHIEELQCTLKLPLGMPLGALPQHLLLTSTRIPMFCHYQFQMEFTGQQIFTSTPLMQTEQTPLLPLSTDNTFDSYSTPLPLNTSTPPLHLGQYSFSPY